MSAPRKIWVQPQHNGAVGECWHDATTDARTDWPAYHHDDVVRELMDAANRLVGHEQWGTYKYTDDGMWADGEALRAALAKIAQEG